MSGLCCSMREKKRLKRKTKITLLGLFLLLAFLLLHFRQPQESPRSNMTFFALDTIISLTHTGE